MPNVTPVLRDAVLDEKLLKEGYVVVPFLNTDEVRDLVNFYYQNNPQTLEGMYATAHAPDVDFRIKMNGYIREVFARAIEGYFTNCRALGGSYVVKGRGAKGTLYPHQDWNIVDEKKFRSFNIWVPLIDLNENNGAIKILPKSHTWLESYRSANISSAYEKVYDELWKHMVTLNMSKGEALIYDHRLLHASGENKSEELRLATVYGVIPSEAQMLYYHKASDKTVEVFESNPDFFLYQNIFEGPVGLKKVDSFSHNYYQPDEAALLRFIKEEPAQAADGKSLFSSIKNLLGLR